VLSGPDNEVTPKHYATWPYTGVTYRRKDGRLHPPASLSDSKFCPYSVPMQQVTLIVTDM
jgi:hypothetical protein